MRDARSFDPCRVTKPCELFFGRIAQCRFFKTSENRKGCVSSIRFVRGGCGDTVRRGDGAHSVHGAPIHVGHHVLMVKIAIRKVGKMMYYLAPSRCAPTPLAFAECDLHVFDLIDDFAVSLDDPVGHAHCQPPCLQRLCEINLIRQKLTVRAYHPCQFNFAHP